MDILFFLVFFSYQVNNYGSSASIEEGIKTRVIYIKRDKVKNVYKDINN